MKTIIAGCRYFDDYELLTQTCETHDISEVISGGARGADSLGEKYAVEKGILLHIFPANWDRWGKSAGFRRNEEMVKYADALIAFWDGKSRGTADVIRRAEKKGIKVTIISI